MNKQKKLESVYIIEPQRSHWKRLKLMQTVNEGHKA